MGRMVIMLGATRALLDAHKIECVERTVRAQQMFEDLKESIQAVERRQEASVAELSAGLREIQQSVAKLTQRLAWIVGAATAIVLLAQHFHLLSGINLPSIGN